MAMSDETGERYWRDGFVAPIRVCDADAAARHRRRLEWAEQRVGPLHYRVKVHTILTSPWELVTTPALLDAVEACIGPNILVYDVEYIVKEPGSAAKVNWHQDLTYWGLSDDDAQVSAWIALSPATPESGCMKMVPGSHRAGRIDHTTPERKGDDDVLDLGQYIDGVDDATAVHVPLRPGEASLHHGWTVHASAPNASDDRRIGLNVQFLAPHCHQLMHGDDTAILVRGVDEHGHFGTDVPATRDLDPVAVERQAATQRLMKGNYETVRDTRP
jgi:ectoine hydroxylase-related dioxygenase (phytanoyl-CoA dioxygenase family)